MKCISCGFENDNHARFCMMCGSKLEKAVLNNDKEISKKLAYVVREDEIIDDELLEDTVETNIDEIIYYTYGKVMDKECFKYDIQGFTTIKEYISKDISKDKFVTMLLNLISTIRKLQFRGIKLKNIILKPAQIFINKNNLKVKMICIPISNRNTDRTLKELLKEIILSAEFDYNENCKYVRDILRFVEENDCNDLVVLQDGIEKYLDNSEKDHKNVPKKIEKVEQPLEKSKKQQVYLIRLSTDERINIDKPIFRIGKDKHNADYKITNNTAVSRKHAEIIKKNNEYFILDVGSTNHTFINGDRIEEKKEIPLEDGDIIKLGNEEFKIFFN